MFNKLQFNNLVITNKQKIRQGCIQTINTLVHKIRKLKSLIVKHPECPKLKERLRKTKLNLDYTKRLKCIDIIKHVLLLEKNPAAVITNALASPMETAVALLAGNKIIKDLVQMFKQQLNLTDTDCKWRERLVEPSRRRVKIKKTVEKRQKRKEIKEKKLLARKRIDWLKENNPNSENNGQNTCATVTGEWKIECIDQDTGYKETIFKEVDPKEEYNEIKAPPIKTKTDIKKKVKKYSKGKKRLIELGKSVKDSARDLDLNKDFNEEETKEECSPPRTATYVVDPFFITESGDYYLSSALVPETNSSTERKTENNTSGESKTKKTTLDSNKSSRNLNSKKDEIDSHNNNTHSGQSIHPSWAAKKKLKPIIASFEGKKITFDDDSLDIISSKEIKTNSQSSKIGGKCKNDNSENLHPSWAAKQKLKSTIATFQGKKITFVDEVE